MAEQGGQTRPLDGIKVIEMAGLAPTPYCGMILADFGADVVIVDQPSKGEREKHLVMKKDPLRRGKRSIRIDLKTDQGANIVRRMIRVSDVLVEPYRPGVMEKLGLGPNEVLELNPKLIYARLTGWGQIGPYSSMAGHDINYIALSGALSMFRRKGERPLPPCNLLADFAGGGMLCTMGILLALIERNKSGKGQIVDSAMIDGAASLCTLFYGLLGNHLMTLDIGTHELDSGAPFYQTYETADGKYVAVGAVESKFYAEFLNGLGIDPSSLPPQRETEAWPELKSRFAEILKTKTRDEWATIFEGKDACVASILELDEVDHHPHNRSRGLLINLDGILQPAPAPRLSRTPGEASRPCKVRRSGARELLEDLGYSTDEIEALYGNEIVE